jgi:cytochrome d ubiquinol oxidase subunit II
VLILRPAGILYRSRIDDPRWRTAWDVSLCLGGVVATLVFGVAFGNVLVGAPFRFDDDLRVIYAGNLFGLFSPFAVLCGLISVLMITMHGAAYVAAKTEEPIRARARTACLASAVGLGALFVVAGVWAARLNGYAMVSAPQPWGPSNPLLKVVARRPGALMANYHAMPWMLAAPLLGGFGILATMGLSALPRPRPVLTFLASGLATAGVVATAGVSLFPFLLPSSLDPDASLTIWDASSSPTTLLIMTVATAILLPIVLAYSAWVYRVMRGPVTQRSVEADHHAY